MKIARVSNFDSATYAEKFVENIPNIPETPFHLNKAMDFCAFLNEIDELSPDYYELVENDYILKDGDPNA